MFIIDTLPMPVYHMVSHLYSLLLTHYQCLFITWYDTYIVYYWHTTNACLSYGM